LLSKKITQAKIQQPKGILLKLDFEKAYERVKWDFLEVLWLKGFDTRIVHRISQLVSGGHTVISINGKIGPFFHNKRGVRKGDPLSQQTWCPQGRSSLASPLQLFSGGALCHLVVGLLGWPPSRRGSTSYPSICNMLTIC
jgi:hypothetical protein